MIKSFGSGMIGFGTKKGRPYTSAQRSASTPRGNGKVGLYRRIEIQAVPIKTIRLLWFWYTENIARPVPFGKHFCFKFINDFALALIGKTDYIVVDSF